MKPLINLDDLEMESFSVGPFAQRYGDVSTPAGAKKLGYNLTVVPPGKKGCPFHNHHVNEEMFLVLEGEGELRFGEAVYPIKKHDVIACPPGGRGVAHQITNTGSADLKYLALSTKERAEIVEYPDSDKVGVVVGDYGDLDLRLFFPAASAVDYNEGEV